MPTTTNFGWTTPADTDLVKDGASAIRTLGSNIDTSLVDLKGGTSGQYLTKNSNTDLDYAWVTLSAGGMTLISTTTLTGSSVTLSTIPSTYNDLQIIIQNFRPATDAVNLRMRFNSDTGTNYNFGLADEATDQTWDWSSIYFGFSTNSDNGASSSLYQITIPDYKNATTYKIGRYLGIVNDATSPTTSFDAVNSHFQYKGTSAISSIDLFPASGNFTSGTVLLYGVK
jgi:hypothetical protein